MPTELAGSARDDADLPDRPWLAEPTADVTDESTADRSLGDEIEHFLSHVTGLLGLWKSRGFCVYGSEAEIRAQLNEIAAAKLIEARREWIHRTVVSGLRLRPQLVARGERAVIVSRVLRCIDNDDLFSLKQEWGGLCDELREIALRHAASGEDRSAGNTHDAADPAEQAAQTEAVPGVDAPNKANSPAPPPPRNDEWRAWALCKWQRYTQTRAAEILAKEAGSNWYQSKVFRAIERVDRYLDRGGSLPDFLTPPDLPRSPGRTLTMDPSSIDKGSPTTHTQRLNPGDPENP